MKIFVVFFLLGYYLLVYLFLVKPNKVDSFPSLKVRLGTVLWNEESEKFTKGGEFHAYCYYPSKKIEGKSSEYLIKRVRSIYDCQQWYGVMEVKESFGLSEKEKFWWSKDQLL